MNKEEILPILQKVRSRMLVIAREFERSKRTDLGGWCVVCAEIIFDILKHRGYKPFVCSNNFHAFVFCDGYYIDITIDQFGTHKFPAVYCKTRPASLSYHRKMKKTDDSRLIWKKLCPGWNRPLKHKSPTIQALLESVKWD